MVTRRPIELTLVNRPDIESDYACFLDDADGAGQASKPIYDFDAVSERLCAMNLEVGGRVSPKPIRLAIYSQRVPDMCLIDLPGYIQITSKSQPSSLKSDIVELCEGYLKAPNILLAISPADVDLANSEALRASRLADPDGARTIGVISKLDLVDPETALRLLKNDEYPLVNGYIGVSCTPGPRSAPNAKQLSATLQALSENKECRELIGVQSLQKRLLGVLRAEMTLSIDNVHRVVLEEYEDTQYKLKCNFEGYRTSPVFYLHHLYGQVRSILSSLSSNQNAEEAKAIYCALFLHMLEINQQARLQSDALTAEPADFRAFLRSGLGRRIALFFSESILTRLSGLLRHSDPSLAQHQATLSAIQSYIQRSSSQKHNRLSNQVEDLLRPIKSQGSIPLKSSLLGSELLELLSGSIRVYYRCLQKELLAIFTMYGADRIHRVSGKLEGCRNYDDLFIDRRLVGATRSAVLINFRLRFLRAFIEQCRLPSSRSLARFDAVASDIVSRALPTLGYQFALDLSGIINDDLFFSPKQEGLRRELLLDSDHILSDNRDVSDQLLLERRAQKLSELLEKVETIKSSAPKKDVQ